MEECGVHLDLHEHAEELLLSRLADADARVLDSDWQGWKEGWSGGRVVSGGWWLCCCADDDAVCVCVYLDESLSAWVVFVGRKVRDGANKLSIN